MTTNREWLKGYKPLTKPIRVFLGDNRSLTVSGVGHMDITLPSGALITIHGVFHIPGLMRNLISVTALTSTGSSIEFFHDYCVLHFKLPTGKFELLKLPQRDRLYPVRLTPSDQPSLLAENSILTLHLTKVESTLLWHYRLGHINAPTLQRMSKQELCHGLPNAIAPIDVCEGCLLGKATHRPFPHSLSRTQQLNQLVHSDLCGPMETLSLSGSSYFLTFIDDYSRYTTVYFVKQKSQVFSCFQDYWRMALRQHDLPIRVICSDNGGEYISKAMKDFCHQEGIVQQLTVPYTPQQNGVSERKNRSLVQAALAMILTASLSKAYWEEAVATACYLQNQIPHSIEPDCTPYFQWFGKVPNLRHLRIFGCPAYTVQPLDIRQKFDATSSRMVFVGYGDRFGVKAYILYDPLQ